MSIKQRRIVLTISDDEELLVQWYDSMPTKVRSAMLRLLVTNALKNGMADGHWFLGDSTANKSGHPAQDEQGQPAGMPTQQEPAVNTTAQQEHERKRQEPQKTENPARKVELRAPEGASKEELIAFTLANLPEGATPEMREVAKEYYKATPYSYEDLTVVTKMFLAEKEMGS